MASKTDITNRQDISLLVNTFYKKIREDKVLGPIFNGIIDDWDAHLVLLTDFWETQLFLKRKYHGNPITAHQDVDDKLNHTITSEHFEGETAWIAKNRAQKMSTMLFMHIYQHRTE